MADARTNVVYPYTFGAKTGPGAPRLGLVTGDFTITVRNPQNTATMAAPAVVEIGGGQYRFDIAASFTNTHGAGPYGITVTLTLAPTDTFTDRVGFTVDDADTLATLINALNNLSQADVQAALTAQGYTIARAANLDNLDASISSIAALIGALNDLSIVDVQTAMTAQGYTVARAVLLDNLDATVSSVITAIAALNDLSITDVQTALTAQGYTAARALLLDNLDALVSSRAVPGDAMDLIASAVTAIDTELTSNHGAGAWTSASSTDWTAAERNQIRERLGLDGVTASPTSVVASLVTLILDQVNTVMTGYSVGRVLRTIHSAASQATSGGPATQVFERADDATTQLETLTSGSGDRAVVSEGP